MQRRDPKGFFEGVMAEVPELSAELREHLLDVVNDKTGTKRAARIAAILSGVEAVAPPRPVEAPRIEPQRSSTVTAERLGEEPADEGSVPPRALAASPAPARAASEEEEEPAAAAPPPPPAAKPKRTRAKKAAAPPPKGNKNPFAGEIGDDDEGGGQ